MLTILIVNVDNLLPTAYDEVYRTVGLDTVSFRPTAAVTSIFDWPTLGSMIDSNLRLLTFLDNAADFTSVPYLLDGTHVPPSPVKFLILIMRLQSLQTFGRLPLMSPILPSIAL